MLKIFSLFFSLLLTTGLSAQASFSGEATYKTATTSPIKFDESKLSPDQIKMIKQRMSKALQKEFTLQFNRNESLYQENVALEKDGAGGGMRFMSMITGSGGTYFKNLAEQRYVDQTEFFGKKFLIKDSLENFDWKLGKETKSIGNYICNKATTQRIVTVSKVESSGEEVKDTTINDTIEITAWYTMQIPVSHGPAQYGGLPGLILELNDGATSMLCTKVSLKAGEALSLAEPDDGEEVSQEEYNEITTEKMEEMRTMYGGRRGGGRGGNGSFEIRIGR